MIKNSVMFFALALTALLSAACASSDENKNSPAEMSNLQKYVQQVTPKLEALDLRHKEMMGQIANSIRQGPTKSYHFDKETIFGHTGKVRGELDKAQQEFLAMTIPKSAESFAGNVMQLIHNERVFIDKIENAFSADNQEISEGKWTELTANAQLPSFQKDLLVGAMMRVSGATQNANARGR